MRLRHLVPAVCLSVAPLAAHAHNTSNVAASKPDAEGYIRDWLVMAPGFYNPRLPIGEGELDKKHLPNEAQLHPVAGEAAKPSNQPLTWGAHHSADYMLDFLAYAKLDKTKALSLLGYGVAYVVADAPKKGVELRFGSNDMAKVFLNGKQVIKHDAPRLLAKDQNVVKVDLKKGINTLVVKSVNTEQRWEVAARFVGESGTPVPGLMLASGPKADIGAVTAKPDSEGFIRDWVVLAPIDYEHRPFGEGQLLTKHLPDEAHLMPRPEEKVWLAGYYLPFTPYQAKKTPYIDFNEHARTQRDQIAKARWEANDTLFNSLSYAVTYVIAPKDMKVTAKIGANDHGRLWVNGKPVAAIDKPGPLKPDAAGGPTTLKKGANLVVLKVVNSGDNWQGALRFVDAAGTPVTDLDLTLTPPASLSR